LISKPEGKRQFDLVADERRILKFNERKKEWKGSDRIHVRQNRDRLRVLVNPAMKFLVLKKMGNYLTY
jgi:hypothetical protein